MTNSGPHNMHGRQIFLKHSNHKLICLQHWSCHHW